MINILKMDILRMFKAKCFYITLGILLFFFAFAAYSPILDGEDQQEVKQEVSEDTEVTNLGITVNFGDREITLENILDTIMASGVLLLFTGVFMIVFVAGESNSGFIKNIAGIVKKRWHLILSKNLVAMLFVAIEFLMMVVITFVGVKMFLPEVSSVVSMNFLQTIGLQYLLHVAFAALCIMVITVTNSKVVSIVVTIAFTTGLGLVIVSYLDKILEKVNVTLSNYLISSNVNALHMVPSTSQSYRILGVFLFAVILYNVCSSVVIEKRDIR